MTNLNNLEQINDTLWDNEELFHTGDSSYSSIFDSFKKCTNTILLEIHYLDDHKLGRQFCYQVLCALKRGVKVCLIIDGFSPRSIVLKRWFSLFQKYGGEITFFHTLPWHRLCIKGLWNINKRSHKKVILIDERIAYLGSYNVDTRQMSRHYGGEGWRDVGICVEGAEVRKILNGFFDTWKYCNGLDLSSHKHFIPNSIVRLNHESSWRKSHFKNLIDKISTAKERVYISNPYFVPDSEFLKALELASNRGVDVKIIIPQKSDLRLFPLINSIFYRDLIKKGIGFYEYLPSILHAKIMIIDEWMMIGSSNLNSRTQKHDWEIDILLTKSQTKQELLDRFFLDLKNSSLISYGQALERQRSSSSLPISFLRAFKYFL